MKKKTKIILASTAIAFLGVSLLSTMSLTSCSNNMSSTHCDLPSEKNIKDAQTYIKQNYLIKKNRLNNNSDYLFALVNFLNDNKEKLPPKTVPSSYVFDNDNVFLNGVIVENENFVTYPNINIDINGDGVYDFTIPSFEIQFSSNPWIGYPNQDTINNDNPIGDIETDKNFKSEILEVAKNDWTLNTNTYTIPVIENATDFPGWPNEKKPWNEQTSENASVTLTDKNNQQVHVHGWRSAIAKYNKIVITNGDSKLNNGEYDFNSPDFIQHQIRNNQLKVHPSAINGGMFNLSPLPGSQKMVKKEMTVSSQIRGIIPLGLYVPPGKVAKIKFNKNLTVDDFNKIGLTVNINEEMRDINRNWGRGYVSKRMPWMRTNFNVAKFINHETNELLIGSPYGGSIVFETNYFNSRSPIWKDINFVVEDVLETPFYVHGYTTQEEWNRMLNECKTPTIQLMADGLNVLELADNQNGNYIEKYTRVFPKNNVEYAAKLMKLSNYAVLSDEKFNTKAVTICAQDNVSSGDGCCFYWEWKVEINPSWSPLFSDTFRFNPSAIWGFVHEINHCFQDNPNGGRWGLNGGGEVTNNVLSILSFIAFSNDTNQRTESNTTGYGTYGWGWVGNGYSMLNGTPTDLRAYGSLAHGLGVQQTIEIIRDSNRYSKFSNSDNSSLKDFEFIYQASKTSGLNLIDYYKIFNKYPKDESQWTSEMKNMYNEIKDFPRYIPTVNLYANRSFIKTSKGTLDTGLVQDPYRVYPKGKTELQISKYTTSTYENENLKPIYSNIKIIKQPKIGKVEVSNDKNSIIYDANFTSNNQIDSFVYSIEDNLKNEYTFEIQLQPSISATNIEEIIYEIPEDQKNEPLSQLYDKSKNGNFEIISKSKHSFDSIYSPDTFQRYLYTYKTYYVPEKDGYMRWSGIWNQAIMIKVNGEIVTNIEQWSYDASKFYHGSKPFETKKDEPLLIEIVDLNRNGGTAADINMDLYYVNSLEYDKNSDPKIDKNAVTKVKISNRSIPPCVEIQGESIVDILKKDWTPMLIKKNINNINDLSICNNGLISYDNSNLINNIYTNTLHNQWSNDELKTNDITKFKDGNKLLHTNWNETSLIMAYTFKNDINFNSILIENRKDDNRPEQHATHISFYTFDTEKQKYVCLVKQLPIPNHKEKNVIVDLKTNVSTVNKKIYIKLENLADSPLSKKNFISLQGIKFNLSNDLNKIVASNNTNDIIYKGQWNPTTTGVLNNISYETNKANSSFEFMFYGDTFILGSHLIPINKFDIYVDGVLYKSNYNALKEMKNFSFTNIFYHTTLTKKGQHKIKIVLKDNTFFNLGYIAYN